MALGFFHYTQLESHQPVSSINNSSNSYHFRGVHVCAKAYTPEESARYLGRNLLRKGVRPIELTIHNNTACSLCLSDASLDFDSLDASSVANRVHSGYIPRSIGFKVASAFFWPFVIPSIIDSITTLSHHREMKVDYAARTLKSGGETLLPYSTTHRVIFIEKHNLRDEMTLSVHNLKTDCTTSIPTKIELP